MTAAPWPLHVERTYSTGILQLRRLDEEQPNDLTQPELPIPRLGVLGCPP
jgi:hypothetical protein